METDKRVMEFCPHCGQGFNIKETLLVRKPEVKFTNRGPVCDIAERDLEVDLIRAEVLCNNRSRCKNKLCLVETDGEVLSDYIPDAYTEGLYHNGAGSINFSKQTGRKINLPPLSILVDLGCKPVRKEVVNIQALGIHRNLNVITYAGEVVVKKPTSEDHIYDIGNNKWYLFHYHGYITEGVEHEDHQFERSENIEDAFALIDKKSLKVYVKPKKTKNYKGFTFSNKKMYVFIPQKGNNLADAEVFRDNTRFIAYKTKSQYGNDKTRKKETIWDYLVDTDEEENFRALMRRSTRIFSTDDYSGVGKYNKDILYYIGQDRKHRRPTKAQMDESYPGIGEENESLLDSIHNYKEYKSPTEVMREEDIYDLYRNLIEEYPEEYLLQSKVEDFVNFEINPENYISEDEEFTDDEEKEERENEIRESFHKKYDKVLQYLEECCPKDYGDVDKILYGRFSDAMYGGQEDFVKHSDKLKLPEYYDIDNSDIINACKYNIDPSYVRTSKKDDMVLHHYLRIGDVGLQSIKRTKAHGVAFNYNKYDYPNEISFNDIMTRDKVPSMIVEGVKPTDEFSSYDWKRHRQGIEVTEVTEIIFGQRVSEDDAITLHCLGKKPLSDQSGVIAVTGSRHLPIHIRTQYLDTKRNGRRLKGYYTPAVSIWRGYYLENNIKVLFARIAQGSDISAIVAALEVNQQLITDLTLGKITIDEYNKRYINIVCILHGYYGSFDFNNPGLRAILTEVIKVGGYVLSKTPKRKKRGAEEDDGKFKWFDRRIDKANKLLVSLAPTLVALCRAKYSGTTNTIELAKAAGKEVIEITSPENVFIDYKAMNDVIWNRGDKNDYYYTHPKEEKEGREALLKRVMSKPRTTEETRHETLYEGLDICNMRSVKIVRFSKTTKVDNEVTESVIKYFTYYR